MINELYLYSYANEPNKSPWRERLRALLPLRETATFPPQADHVLVVFSFGRGRTWGAALKPPNSKQIRRRGKDPTEHIPETILNNFTCLGHSVGQMFASLSPHNILFIVMKFDTFHSQCDISSSDFTDIYSRVKRNWEFRNLDHVLR